MLSIKKLLLIISVTTAVGVSCSVIDANAEVTAGVSRVINSSLSKSSNNEDDNEDGESPTVLAGATHHLSNILDDVSNELDDEEKYEATHTKTGYTNTGVNVRKERSKDSNKLDLLYINTKIQYVEDKNSKWVKIKYNDGNEGYVKKEYISDNQTKIEVKKEVNTSTNSSSNNTNSNSNSNIASTHLTRSAGVNTFQGHRESYYNLDMSGVVQIMRNAGYNYNYWVRDDGVKMFGNYVMIAANFNLYPRGTIIQCSLGTAIVCDTGGFVSRWPNGFDIATAW